MAMSYIGSFAFITMTRPPLDVHERLITETRAGAEGVAVWKLGKAGKTFDVQTVRDCVDQAAAAANFQAYTTLIEQGPQPLIYGGVNWAWPVKVIDIKPDEIAQTLLNIRHGSTSHGLLKCTWTLLPWI